MKVPELTIKNNLLAVLIVLAVTTCLSLIFNGLNEDAIAFGLMSSFVFAMALSIVNLIAMIVFFSKKEKPRAIQCLISAGILFVVGFSSCFGGFMLSYPS